MVQVSGPRQFLHLRLAHRKILVLGRRIGQRRRATRAPRPAAILQEGPGFGRARLYPAGSPVSDKRIILAEGAEISASTTSCTIPQV